jgi:ParB family chromosome partitioning protein
VNQGYQTLKTAQLYPSKTNPRKTFDSDKLKEMADSIRNVGLIQPIVARPGEEGKYEIVAGERRWRAAQIAEREELHVIIREMTDAEVIEAQVTENLVRVDVHPYEEMQGMMSLMKLDSERYTVQELAAKFGKSVSFIVQRLSLGNLIPEALEQFRNDEIGFSHALLIARLDPEEQEIALQHAFSSVYVDGKQEKRLATVAELRSYIQKNIALSLASTLFDREDAALYPEAGSCLSCPKRSGYNTHLFPDISDDTCYDGTCYSEKVSRHVTISGMLQLAGDYRPVPDGSPALPRRAYTVVGNEDDCGHVQKGIVICGYNVGAVLSVCNSQECELHLGHRDRPVAEDEDDGERETQDPAAAERALAKTQIDKKIQSTMPAILCRELTKNLTTSLSRNDMHMLARLAADVLTDRDEADAYLTMANLCTLEELAELSYEEIGTQLNAHLEGLKGKELVSAIFRMLYISAGCTQNQYKRSALLAESCNIYSVDIESIETRLRKEYESDTHVAKTAEEEQKPESAPADSVGQVTIKKTQRTTPKRKKGGMTNKAA